MSEKYNGWTNYETWNVKLWIDNDQGSQEYWNERADDCIAAVERGEGNTFAETPRDKARILLSEMLKDEHENNAQDMLENSSLQSSMYADLLGAALGSVNWHEIAESMLDEAAERNPEKATDEAEPE